MKKVLICTPNLAGGGAEKVLVNILKSFDYNHYNVTLLLLWNYGTYLNQIPSQVKIKYLWPNNKNINKNIRSLKLFPGKYYNQVITEKYDIEIAFLEGSATNLIAHSNNQNSYKIAWVHTNIYHYHWTKKEFLLKPLEKKAYQKFDKIVFVSNDSKNGFDRLFNIFYNSSIIYNSLDLKDINHRASQPIDLKEDYLVTVGRLIPEKGFKVLIEAFQLLIKNDNYQGNLLIIGEGWMKKILQEHVNELGLQERVILHGFDDNPYKYIKNAQFFVCSSLVEGYSLAVAEALCLGKAVLSTNCYGPNEILKNGELGMIVDQGINSLYEGMKIFINKPSVIKKFESRISSQVINRFSLETQMYEVERLLNIKD